LGHRLVAACDQLFGQQKNSPSRLHIRVIRIDGLLQRLDEGVRVEHRSLLKDLSR
jgi:hypothetical protein